MSFGEEVQRFGSGKPVIFREAVSMTAVSRRSIRSCGLHDPTANAPWINQRIEASNTHVLLATFLRTLCRSGALAKMVLTLVCKAQ